MSPREIQWRIQTFTNTVYFSSEISLVQLFQCSYTALTVLIQLNSPQESKKSGPQSVHQYVKLMLTLDLSRDPDPRRCKEMNKLASLRIKWNVLFKIHQRHTQTWKQQTVLSLFLFEINNLPWNDRHLTMLITSPEINLF